MGMEPVGLQGRTRGALPALLRSCSSPIKPASQSAAVCGVDDEFLTSLDPVETIVDPPHDAAPRAIPVRLDDDVAFRHSGWRHDRQATLQALGPSLRPEDRPHRFANCGAHAWILKSAIEPPTYRIAADFCHDRFCRPCARARARHIAAVLADWAKKRSIRFVTLTIRQEPQPLASQLTAMHKSFRRLRQMAHWNACCKGGVAFTEIKRNVTNSLWNLHLHLLVEGTFLSQSRLSRMWLKATGTSYIVDIRFPSSPTAAVAYVCKYASKGIATQVYGSADALSEAMTALTGRKLCLTFGTARGLQLNEPATEEAWTAVCSLATLRTQAARGVPEACTLLTFLQDRYSCPTNQPTTRGPPNKRPIFNYTSTFPVHRAARNAEPPSHGPHGRC